MGIDNTKLDTLQSAFDPYDLPEDLAGIMTLIGSDFTRFEAIALRKWARVKISDGHKKDHLTLAATYEKSVRQKRAIFIMDQ